MSVCITLDGEIIVVLAEDDLAPHLLCDDDCSTCAAAGTDDCPVRMRRLELIADQWLLAGIGSGRVDKKKAAV